MKGGGPIQTVTIDGRNFSVAHDAEASRKLGGYEKERQMNGDGTSRPVLTRVPGTISGLSISIDDDREDQEFLTDIQNDFTDVDISVTFVDGTVYGGKGSIEGEAIKSSSTGLMEITLTCPKWEKQ